MKMPAPDPTQLPVPGNCSPKALDPGFGLIGVHPGNTCREWWMVHDDYTRRVGVLGETRGQPVSANFAVPAAVAPGF